MGIPTNKDPLNQNSEFIEKHCGFESYTNEECLVKPCKKVKVTSSNELLDSVHIRSAIVKYNITKPNSNIRATCKIMIHPN